MIKSSIRFWGLEGLVVYIGRGLAPQRRLKLSEYIFCRLFRGRLSPMYGSL